jgi:hypothetical protein
VTDHAAVAERIRTAYSAADLDGFGQLLASDVRWGDDYHPNRCRSRQDVLSTFQRWIGGGVAAEVLGVDSGPHGVMARLHINWTDPDDKPRGTEIFHVFMTGTDGLVTEIRRYDDARSAKKAIR